MLLPLLMNLGMLGASRGPGTIISFQASKPIDWEEVERIRGLLKKKKKELKKVNKQVQSVEQKLETRTVTDGILANLHRLEVRQQAIQVEIAELGISLEHAQAFIGGLDLDDDEDEWLLLI